MKIICKVWLDKGIEKEKGIEIEVNIFYKNLRPSQGTKIRTSEIWVTPCQTLQTDCGKYSAYPTINIYRTIKQV